MKIKVKIIVVGKFKEPAYKEIESEYVKRLKRFGSVEIIELDEYGYKNDSEIDKAKDIEAENILKRVQNSDVVIALDEKGTQRSSKDLASFIERLASFGETLCFVIGGGTGMGKEVFNRANHKISLSNLTLTHNFARVLLEEQLYRSCTIIEGSSYHKE